MVKFRPNPAQAYYLKRRTRRNIILKARQKGITKVIDLDQLIDCIRRSTAAVVISHEKEATKRLFSAVRNYIYSLDVKPAMSIDSKQEIKFPKTGSSYFIGTAGQKAFGRGDTINRAHLSEAAFYDDLKKLLAGIAEAAEYGQIDIESTPNGRGNDFHDEWEKAKNGQSPYTPIFIPWFIDTEYSADSMTEDEKDGLSEAVQKILKMPDDEFMAQLTDEEKALMERVKNEYVGDDFEGGRLMLTPGQLKWRRYKIWDKGELFFQEYPEDDVSCFLQAGRSVFKHIITDPSIVMPMDDEKAMEKWWATRYPDEEDRAKQIEAFGKRMLFAAVDGAEGTDDGDRHVFSILDPLAKNGQAGIIYEYASNEPIDVFWENVETVLMKDKRSKYRLILGIEKNGVGLAHCREAIRRGIRHREWNTTGTNRGMMITELEAAYRKEELIEGYPEAEAEARNMIYKKNERAEHPDGKHDDRVFSRAIALQMSKVPIPRVTAL